LGFSLPEAKLLLRIGRSADLACVDAKTVGQRHLQAIKEKICNLQQMQHSLEQLMEPCLSGWQDCVMLETLLEASKMEWSLLNEDKARN